MCIIKDKRTRIPLIFFFNVNYVTLLKLMFRKT